MQQFLQMTARKTLLHLAQGHWITHEWRLGCPRHGKGKPVVEMPFPGSGCVIAGGYLLTECVDSATVQIHSVQSNSIDWTWLAVIGWASAGWRSSASLVGETGGESRCEYLTWYCSDVQPVWSGERTLVNGSWRHCMYDVFFACVVAIWVSRVEFAVRVDVCRVVVNSFYIVFDLHTYIWLLTSGVVCLW